MAGSVTDAPEGDGAEALASPAWMEAEGDVALAAGDEHELHETFSRSGMSTPRTNTPRAFRSHSARSDTDGASQSEASSVVTGPPSDLAWVGAADVSDSGDDPAADEARRDSTANAPGAPDGGAAGGSIFEDPRHDGCKLHGCAHYRRRCKLLAPCCGRFFWCRFCHNDAMEGDDVDPAQRHQIDRHRVTTLQCALCGDTQPVARECRSCKVSFGEYSCLECRLFDDDTSKKQFHCAKCGICRVGGRENFWHCDHCEACFGLEARDGHKCISEVTKQQCPICIEFLFDSVKRLSVLPCGHVMHQECHRQCLANRVYKCPWCLRSTVELDWRSIDEQVAQTPMPHEYRHMVVLVTCNDCTSRSHAPFHVVGLKCGRCGSYNTSRVGNLQPAPAPAGVDAGAGGDGADYEDALEAGAGEGALGGEGPWEGGDSDGSEWVEEEWVEEWGDARGPWDGAGMEGSVMEGSVGAGDAAMGDGLAGSEGGEGGAVGERRDGGGESRVPHREGRGRGGGAEEAEDGAGAGDAEGGVFVGRRHSEPGGPWLGRGVDASWAFADADDAGMSVSVSASGDASGQVTPRSFATSRSSEGRAGAEMDADSTTSATSRSSAGAGAGVGAGVGVRVEPGSAGAGRSVVAPLGRVQC